MFLWWCIYWNNIILFEINNMEEIKLGDEIQAFGGEYEIVGISRMTYDEECEGEPEWKITKEIQEVAIAKIYPDISYQKPSWHKLSELKLQNINLNPMSNTTLTKHCPLCPNGGVDLTPSQSELHFRDHMSNSTQNDVYIVTYAYVNYDGKTRCAWCGEIVDEWTTEMRKVHTDAHSWGDKELADARKEGHELGRAESVEFEIDNARKEVIRRIEAMPDKDVRPQITVWLESKEFCIGYNKALSDVLTTLREEDSNG